MANTRIDWNEGVQNFNMYKLGMSLLQLVVIGYAS